MVSSELTMVSRKLYLVRVFLGQSFTILRYMLLDLDFNVFVLFFVFFTVKVQRWITEA